MKPFLISASLAIASTVCSGADEANFDKEGYLFQHMDGHVKLYTKMEAKDSGDTVKVSVWNDNDQPKHVKLAIGTSYEKDKIVSVDVEANSRKDTSVSFTHSAGQRVNGSVKAVTDR